MELLDYGSSDEDDVGGHEQEPPQRSKVLKLASVLPQHILDRLTKGDEDSNSENEANVSSEASRKRIDKTSSTTRMSYLLSNLTGMKPKHSSLPLHRSPFNCEIPVNDSSTTTADVRIGAESSLGEAFLRPKITIESKAQSNFVVRDIHAESSLVVELEPEAERRLQVPPLASQMKRPLIQAAPPVKSATEIKTNLQTIDPSSMSRPASNKVNSRFTTKKDRQQLERELRRGNVGAVDDGIAIDGVKPTDHTPNVVDYEAMTTIRNIPTTMYDPGSGQMKQAKVSKAKNQIHFLVHQAAELERRRAEQGPARPSHRADAKRKYGF
jgi:hypothetical protein